MKRKFLLTFVAFAAMLLGTLNVSAQFDDGEYLLKNVESGQFLQGDSYWGTKAVTGEIPYLVTLTKVSDGVYTIMSQTNNGGNSQYIGSSADPYADAASCNMTFTADGDYYTINNGTGNLYIKPTTLDNATVNLVMAGNVTDNTAKWQVISKASIDAEMTAASEKTLTDPINATIYIKDAGFDVHSVNVSSWTSPNTPGGGNAGHGIESWNSASFDTNQTITGLPNGKYKVTCRGYYRWNSASGANDNSAAIAAHADNTEVLNAKLYAGDKSTSLMSVAHYEGTSEALPYSATDCGAQWKAEANFTAGYFLNELSDVLVTDGTLKIGVKKDTKAGTDWTVFDNFQLYYYGVDLTALQENLAARLEVAKAITGKMNTTVSTDLSNAISAAESCEATKSALETATSNLNTAIDAANASVAAYTSIATINTKAAALDEAGQTSYASTLTAYNNGTLETLAEAQTAYVAAVKAQTTEGSNMTDAIVNPSFEAGSYDGWTTTKSNDTGAKLNSNATYTMTPCDGNYIFNTWSVGTAIEQTVSDLPNGVYTLSCYMATDADKTFSLSANGTAVTASSVDKGTAVTITVDDIVIGDGNLAISAGTTDKYWYKADNFTLTYKRALTDDDFKYTLVEGTMNKDVAQEQTDAETTFKAAKTAANYAALQNAIVAAQASKDHYAAAASALAAQKAIIDGTNVYDAEGFATYKSNYETLQSKYDAQTLTNEEAVVNPTTATGWHASTAYNFLLTPWTIGGKACNNFDAGMYINTWSTEGNTDGSNFTTPFFEYWTNDENSLGATTINAEVAVEDGLYTVEALVRVSAKTGVDAADATGITLNRVDATTGDQIGTTQRSMATIKAENVKALNGKLNITFEVASDNNISWLSFKNVKYTKTGELTADDYKPALAAAIADAPAAPTEHVSESGAFDYNKDQVDALSSALTTAQGVYDNASATVAEVQEQTTAVKALTAPSLNAPSATQPYKIILKYSGWNYDNCAMTSEAGARSDMGNYNVQYLSQNANYAQAMYFTTVEGGYNISLIDADGNKRYLCTGTPYGGNNYQIRTTTTATDAMVVTVTRNGDYINLYNVAASNYIGSQDAGVYTVNSHINFVVEETTAKNTISKTVANGKYATICLPYAASLSEGQTAYTVSSVNDNTLTLESVTALEANKAYILGAGEYNFSGVNIAYSAPSANGLLTGVFADTKITEGYVLQTQETTGQAFYVVNGEITVPANHAYLTVSDPGVKMIGFDTNEADAINAVNVEKAANGAIYNVNGQQMNKLQKGINIVNGKKYFVK